MGGQLMNTPFCFHCGASLPQGNVLRRFCDQVCWDRYLREHKIRWDRFAADARWAQQDETMLRPGDYRPGKVGKGTN